MHDTDGSKPREGIYDANNPNIEHPLDPDEFPPSNLEESGND